MVAATAMGASISLGLIHFLCDFSFFSVVIVYLGCKFVIIRMILAAKKERFHHLSSSPALKNSIRGTLERLEEEEVRASEGNSLDTN